MASSIAKQRLREGIALQKAGRRLEAAKLYAAVLRDEPDNANALHLLGTIEIEQQNFDKALEFVHRALKLNPKSAVFHHNVAFIYGARGETAAAEAHYRRAIALRPSYAEAYFNLAGSTRFAPGDSAIAPLESLLAQADLSPADQVFAHFAAGKIYDDLGNYDRAFAHYRKGNAAKRVQPNAAYASHLIDRLIATVDSSLLARLDGAGRDSERPLFVVGMPRSGTSLVEQILSSHPAVHGAGELPDIDSIAAALPGLVNAKDPYPQCLAETGAEVLSGLADAYLRRLAEMEPEADRVVDKAPLNFRHIGLIALLFPKARIVHCRRDPLDTCLSCYFQNFAKGQEYSFDLAELGRFYRDYRRLMEHWQAVLPGAIFDLCYEDLVADPESESRRLLAFCGLAWDPACADFHRTKREVRTASRWQVRQPIYQASIGRWRHYEKHLGPLRAALGPCASESEGEAVET